MKVRCDRCSIQEKESVVYRTWLVPVSATHSVLMFVFPDSSYSWDTQICPRCARWTLRYWVQVRWRLRIGRFLSKILAPRSGYGYGCLRCATSWYFANPHVTDLPALRPLNAALLDSRSVAAPDWPFVHEDPSSKILGKNMGCFPLCKLCWSEITPTDRLPYYEQLWDKWQGMATNPSFVFEGVSAFGGLEQDAEGRAGMVAAVLAGK